MKTILEIFYCKIFESDIFYHKEEVDISKANINPDIVINDVIKDELHKTPQIINDEFIIHSTSWRYDEPDTIILTYLVYSDYLDFTGFETKSLPLSETQVVSNTNPKMPRPQIILEKNVISHGVRHLHWLLLHDKQSRLKHMLCLNSLKAFQKLGVDLAGELVYKDFE